MNDERPLTEEEISAFVDFMEEDEGVRCGVDNCLRSAGWVLRCLHCGDVRFVCDSHEVQEHLAWRWINLQADALLECVSCGFQAKPVDNWRARRLEEEK